MGTGHSRFNLDRDTLVFQGHRLPLRAITKISLSSFEKNNSILHGFGCILTVILVLIVPLYVIYAIINFEKMFKNAQEFVSIATIITIYTGLTIFIVKKKVAWAINVEAESTKATLVAVTSRKEAESVLDHLEQTLNRIGVKFNRLDTISEIVLTFEKRAMSNINIKSESGQVVFGDVTNSTLTNTVNQTTHQIDRLMELIAEHADSDGVELLALLKTVRGFLIAESTDEEQAKRSFEEFFRGATKYAYKVKEIWDLIGSVRSSLR